jgi:DinB superfamily
MIREAGGVGMAKCVFCKKVHDYDREGSFQILLKTSDTLRLLLDDANPEAFSKRETGVWSPRQILIHMVDTEYAYGFRYRYIMAEKEPVVTPYDQNDWSNTFDYGDLDATQLIRAFTPIRRVNLELLQNVDPKLFDKQARHPEYGTITVGMMIPHIAAHDLKHLQQIRDRLPVA